MEFTSKWGWDSSVPPDETRLHCKFEVPKPYLIVTTRTQTFSPSKKKTGLLLVLCIVFTSMGVWMIADGRGMGWLVALFFGLGCGVFIVQLIPGAMSLKLTEEGFIMTSFYRSHLTKWSEVKVFRIGLMGTTRVVMFDYVDEHQQYETGKKLAKNLSGSHGALPNNYGMKPRALLEIMRDWKERYAPTLPESETT